MDRFGLYLESELRPDGLDVVVMISKVPVFRNCVWENHAGDHEKQIRGKYNYLSECTQTIQTCSFEN